MGKLIEEALQKSTCGCLLMEFTDDVLTGTLENEPVLLMCQRWVTGLRCG